ncbi:unnamed protein product [Cylindrotheca closterium]|uniref:Uncharacterized protein n=1 Tax=Cylindrotheca closterium TaxID=2856 RepID=A0AAD2G2J7_9STRA|nr:unnamed protein product [Cylindrotheca closterium]
MEGRRSRRLGYEIEEYKAKHNTVPIPHLMFDVYIRLGEAEEMMENWEAAKLMYFGMTMETDDGATSTPPQQLKMFTGLCRVAYHLKSQKAMGDMDASKVTMARALVYEAPWDDHHHEQVLHLYREIVGEEPETRSSS